MVREEPEAPDCPRQLAESAWSVGALQRFGIAWRELGARAASEPLEQLLFPAHLRVHETGRRGALGSDEDASETSDASIWRSCELGRETTDSKLLRDLSTTPGASRRHGCNFESELSNFRTPSACSP